MTVETPEEKELQRQLAELASVEIELAQRELDLATQVAELQAFERLYVRIVGVKYAQLDQINAEIQQLRFVRKPQDPQLRREAHDAQERARQSEHATAEASGPPERERFQPSDELRQLYRAIAKEVHPDLASDPKERIRRNRVMADVNKAYVEGDVDRLRQLMDEWQTSPEAIAGEGLAEQLIRTIRKIHQARTRLENIAAEIEQLQSSDLAMLQKAVLEAEAQGRDLLAEMARSVENRIGEARRTVREMGGDA
jgi:hypothetical protein